jgi:hypothetical protein
MKKACSYAKKYKAIYPPKCGCEVCAKKWEAKQKYLAKSSDFYRYPENNPFLADIGD